jgi:hypothetical protein
MQNYSNVNILSGWSRNFFEKMNEEKIEEQKEMDEPRSV